MQKYTKHNVRAQDPNEHRLHNTTLVSTAMGVESAVQCMHVLPLVVTFVHNKLTHN